MIIIPAIDIKDGRCVRLRQGRMEESTVFNDDPALQAKTWEQAGAARIHVVDLNGSVDGKPVNLETVRRIVQAVDVPVQLGGGIRDESIADTYLKIGVSTIIVGTLAAKSPDIVERMLERFPGNVAIGIDARAGFVAVEGWTEATHIAAIELAKRFQPMRPSAFIYTDIERDGMMSGPNIDATRDFAEMTSIPVILSGGISNLDDVRNALPLAKSGVEGLIIGRALYEGAINLEKALKLMEDIDAC